MIKETHKNYPKSITPSTLRLNQIRAGKGPGMLTSEEIELLRKSKKEISEACRKYFKELDLGKWV